MQKQEQKLRWLKMSEQHHGHHEYHAFTLQNPRVAVIKLRPKLSFDRKRIEYSWKMDADGESKSGGGTCLESCAKTAEYLYWFYTA